MNITAMSLIGGIVLTCALIVALIGFARWRNHRLRQLYADTRQDGLKIHSICMIREGRLHYPGVALVANDMLQIHSLFNKTRAIPLSQIKVTREETGRCGPSGRYEWRGKQVFHLDTPETTNLAIGVKDAEAWRKALNSRGTGSDRCRFQK